MKGIPETRRAKFDIYVFISYDIIHN